MTDVKETINIKTWDTVYSQGRSLLVWPDENVVTSLNRNRKEIKKGIDIACGAGRHAILMAQMGIESIGVDSSSHSIEFATRRAKEMGLENVNFINDVVQNINIEEQSCDIAIVWGLIHYLSIEDQQKILESIKKLLKPNGILLCTLRSTADSRRGNGKLIKENQYLVDYFDGNTNNVKQTTMYFWDQQGVEEYLKDFKEIKLGHRIIEPIGHKGNKTAHWLIEARK